MSLPSSSSQLGEGAAGESGSGKVLTPENVVISESSSTTTTTTTHSNGSISKEEHRFYQTTILVSDTPSSDTNNMEIGGSSHQQLEVVPDSVEELSPREPSASQSPLFGRSATSGVETDAKMETNAGPSQTNVAAAKEPELIVLSSSTSITDSPAAPFNNSSDEMHLHLDSNPESSEGNRGASTKPKPSAGNRDTVPKDAAGEKTADYGEGKKGDAADGKPEEKSKDAPAEPASGDIEEPCVVKMIIPLGESQGDSAAAETSGAEKPEDEEKEDEGDNIEDSADIARDVSKPKRGGAAGRSRGRSRGSRRSRGRITRSGGRSRSPQQQEEEEMEPTPEDDGDKGEKEMAVDAEGKNEEEKEEESKKGEEKAEDKEEEKATSPKKPRRRTGFDARLAAEAKASGEVDKPESESRRVLRNRYQSPAGSGQEGTPRGRRKQDSASSVDDVRESDGEKPTRRKRGAAAATPRSSDPSPKRQKRGGVASDDHQRSASSDSEAKEEKRTLRTRAADTPKDVGETSRSSAKRTPAARGRRSRGGGSSASRAKNDDPFDFDDAAEPSASPGPFRRVNLSKSNFGDMKFTKASEKSGERSKYTLTSKAAELKKQNTGGSSDTIIISDSPVEVANTPPLYRVTTSKHYVIEKLSPGTKRVLKTVEADKSEGARLTSSLSPDLKRQISPVKQTPSSGNMADVSSMGSSASLGASKKGDSVGHKRYLDNPDNIIDKDDRSGGDRYTGVRSQSRHSGNRSSSSSGKKAGSMSLFSDIDMADDSDTPGGRGRGVKRSARADVDDGDGSGDDSPNRSQKRRRRTTDHVTPKPKQPELKKLTPEEQLNADFPAQNTHALEAGARVLARWTDKCFYAAWILTDEGLGRYKVKFYDGAVKSAPRPDLVPVTQLKEGDVLMVNKSANGGEGDLEPVKITKTPSSQDSDEWYKCIFEVENEVQECTERVSWEKFVIDADQTKNFVTTRENKAAQDITADNITEKRERRTRHRSTAEQADLQQEDREDEGGDDDVQERQSAPRERRTRTPRSTSGTSSSPRRSGVSSAGSSSGTGGSPRRRRGEAFGRVNKVGSPTSRRGHPSTPQIFAGYIFVLTSANRRSKENDASEEERPTTITFNKKHVRQLIEDHGGSVVEDFSQVVDLARCYLIADTHYRTHKYLSALARAVPCVKHAWIHESCAAKQLLDHAPYMLAAGYSLESDKILPWHDKCPELLSGKSVLVYTENRPNNPTSLDFVQIWAPLVKCMGANVIETTPNAGTEPVDILLTDATCSPAQLQAAEARGAKAVSSEWLIQAIITGRQPRPDGHKKYEYDYVEAPAAASGAAANAAPTAGGGGGGGGGSINENA